MEEEAGLFGTNIKWEWVEEKLAKALGTKAKFGKNKSITKIGVDQGFVSMVGRIFTDWTIKDIDLPESVVIKLPTVANIKVISTDDRFAKDLESIEGYSNNDVLEAAEKSIIKGHNAEVAFYRMIQKHNLNIRVPKCFVLEEFNENMKQGVIIMEDLGLDAHIVPVFKNVSPEDLLQVFDTIADVHAFSLKCDEWKTIKMRTMSDQMEPTGMAEMLRTFAKANVDIDRSKMAPLMEKFEKYFDKICNVKLFDEICEEMSVTPVLAHGDLRSENVMWKKEGTKYKLASVIDWQIIHPGCPAEDLARMMLSSLTAKDRREKWEYLLKNYYNMLTNKLGKDPPFSFETLKACYLKILPVAAGMLTTVFGFTAQRYGKSEDGRLNEEAMEIVKEKVLGTLEDAVFYFEKNEMHA